MNAAQTQWNCHCLIGHGKPHSAGNVAVYRKYTGQKVCVQLPTSADNVTLPASTAECWPCSNQSTYFLATGLTAANLLQWHVAAECCDRRTDRQTNRWTLNSFIDIVCKQCVVQCRGSQIPGCNIKEVDGLRKQCTSERRDGVL